MTNARHQAPPYLRRGDTLPYLKPEDRAPIYHRERDVKTPGELNYFITEALVDYWAESAMNYQVINDILGAVEGAKAEFYRRIAVPFEELKRSQHGDVYAA